MKALDFFDFINYTDQKPNFGDLINFSNTEGVIQVPPYDLSFPEISTIPEKLGFFDYEADLDVTRNSWDQLNYFFNPYKEQWTESVFSSFEAENAAQQRRRMGPIQRRIAPRVNMPPIPNRNITPIKTPSKIRRTVSSSEIISPKKKFNLVAPSPKEIKTNLDIIDYVNKIYPESLDSLKKHQEKGNSEMYQMALEHKNYLDDTLQQSYTALIGTQSPYKEKKTDLQKTLDKKFKRIGTSTSLSLYDTSPRSNPSVPDITITPKLPKIPKYKGTPTVKKTEEIRAQFVPTLEEFLKRKGVDTKQPKIRNSENVAQFKQRKQIYIDYVNMYNHLYK